ncbi:MAG TPA: nucleotidyl transferase AbiEii/AbiGii toxin family protein [Thermoanaerobaculia bacterium]|nr:nucleotidyl transferase AbiEii/AbiGii toxin family protein [Thermoanaerobaculia bacterium]
MKTVVLAGVLEALERRGARPALIGGMALAAHGIGRATQDLDILVLDPALLAAECWDGLRALGAQVEIRRGDAGDPLAGVIRIWKESEAPVDVVVGRRPWQEGILDRRKILRLEGIDVPVVEAADLVLLKLDAGGPQDLLDIRLLLRGPGGADLRAEVERRLAALPEPLQHVWLTLRD